MKKYFDIGKWKAMGPEKWIFLLIAGVLIVVISLPAKEEGTNEKEDNTGADILRQEAYESYERELEKRLETLLAKADGVGKVQVMITLESSEELVVKTDTVSSGSTTQETDSSGGSRTVTENSRSENTVLSGGSQGEPYVVKELSPKISGVVVIAEGGGNATVQAEIYEAVQALFDVPAHKIKVLKSG